MKRYVTLEQISDGKLYTSRDMARTDCLGCNGCSKCCHGMGESIVLDPYDIWRLGVGLGKDLTQLMAEGFVELNVVDGVILPNLKMQNDDAGCGFLNESGRCSIHAHRPGICRLFPLGRYYDGEGFRYFVQVLECDKPKAKIKIDKWLDTPDLATYEKYISRFHNLILQAEELQTDNPDETFGKNLNMFLLKTFFLTPYDSKIDFYEQYEAREKTYRQIVPE